MCASLHTHLCVRVCLSVIQGKDLNNTYIINLIPLNFSVSDNSIYLFLQGIKDSDQKLPEDFARLFSEETLIEVGLTDHHVDLYTKKMEKIIKGAAEVS